MLTTWCDIDYKVMAVCYSHISFFQMQVGGNHMKSATLACKCKHERTVRSRSCLHTSVRQGEARVMVRWDG